MKTTDYLQSRFHLVQRLFKRRPLSWKTGILSLSSVAVLSFASVTLFSVTRPGSADAEAWAAWAILNPVDANRLWRQDPELVKEQARTTIAIVNPEIGNRERRKDPAVVEAERLAAFAILNAKALELERRKDPELRRLEEEVWKALVGGAQ